MLRKVASGRKNDGEGIAKIIRLWATEEEVEAGNFVPKMTAYWPEAPQELSKVADSKDYMPELREFISKLKPDNVHVYVIINAMGASEYWGQNSNGDIWPEDQLCHEGDDYGYRTYLKGHVFRHHNNDDPKKAIGDVVFSGYNPHMHRIELVARISKKKAPRTCEKISNGEFPPCSMGAKVEGDVCVYPPCGHFSKKVAEYCDHLKFHMGEMIKDGPYAGLKHGARNVKPKLFDISEVIVPADKTSCVMGDITPAFKFASAELDAFWNQPSWKIAYYLSMAGKQAEIEKEIPVNIEEVFTPADKKKSEKKIQKAAEFLRSREPELPRKLLAKLGRDHTLPQVLSSFAYLGIPLRPSEFQYLVLTRSGQQKLAEDLDGMGYVFAPRFDGLQGAFTLGDNFVLPEIAKEAAAHVPARSLFHPYLTARHRHPQELGVKVASIRLDHREPDILRTVARAYASYLPKLDELWTTEEGIEKVSSAPVTNAVFCRLLDDNPFEKTEPYRLIGETEASRALVSSLTNPDKQFKLASPAIHSRIGNLQLCRAHPEALALLDPDEASHWLIERLG